MLRILLGIAMLGLGSLVACAIGDEPPIPDDPNNPFAIAEENKGSWVWIPIEESLCRDGSSTGIGVRLQDKTNSVMIYLQGGGACYDAQSCQENAEAGLAGETFTSADFTNWTKTLGDQGVFDTTRTANPVATWQHVYIPYCTGDLHGGLNADARVEGVPAQQQFMGYRNMTTFLKLLAPYFSEAAEVALVGASAGGFGVMFNYPQVADAFVSLPVTALVDSAPLLATNDIVTACFQDKVIRTFNLQLPQNCPNCNTSAQGGLLNLYGYLRNRYPDGRFAFASADADLAGVVLLDRESKACGGSGVNIINYRLALLALREDVLKPTNWSSFYWGGLQHTMTQTSSLFFDTRVKGLSAAEWFGQVNAGTALHLAP